jgi:SAM-dependent methyltransferase
MLTAGCDKDYPFARFGMYHGIEDLCRERTFEGPALSISHSRHLLGIMGAESLEVADANFPEANILKLPFETDKFGVVVSDQVFEHIQGLPSVAFKESLRVAKPGGWVLHTTCFIMPQHGEGDYWRFTPMGLQELAFACDAAEACAGGWGHPTQMIFWLLGWQWLPVPKNKWHPLRWLAGLNRPSYASVVWVLARKAREDEARSSSQGNLK